MSDKKSRRLFLQSLAVTGLAAQYDLPGNSYADEISPVISSSLIPEGGGYINPRKVLLYECTRKEIRELLNSGKLKAAIIPTGSTEQHNEHVAMIEDTAASLVVSQYAALKLYPQVIVTPPVSIGVSPYWMERKGTLTLRKETFQEIIFDMCNSLTTHGIRTILIVNGHGGNQAPIKEKIPEIRSKLGITIDFCGSYHEGLSRDELNEIFGFEKGYAISGHAGAVETSIALAAFPERVRYPLEGYGKFEDYKTNTDKSSLEKAGFYKATFDTPELDMNSFEESKHASREKGELLITLSVNYIADKLLKMMS